MAGDTDIQLLKVIKDLQNSIQELCKAWEKNQLPITDASPVLYGLCTKLEYLLQYDQKERKTIFGSQKDYWDYICVCLNSHKCGTNVQKCNHTTRLKTSMGKGRAFIRYCLVQQQLADSLQLCFLNQELASEWYYARNPFLSERLRSDIMEQLYSLNEITFDLALEGVDLDTAWPLGRSEFKTPRRTSGTRIPFNNPFKVMYKKANNRPAKDPEHEKPVDIGGMKESRKTEVQGVSSGTSAPLGASSSLGAPQESQDPILKMYTDSGDSRSDPVQQAQSEFDMQMFQQEERNIGLVSNLDQKPNGSEQPRERGQVDAQRYQGIVTILTTDEKRVTERKVVAEQQPLLEKLNKGLMEKEHIIEQLNRLLEEKEKIHEEESSKLQQGISNLKEMQKKGEEESNRVVQLEESNKFLNETVEEMDRILDQLNQAMVKKDHENMLLRKEVKKMAAVQQAHEEELEKLKLMLGEHQKEYNGVKWDADKRLKIVSEELKNKESILAGFQSKFELETGEQLAEMEGLRSKLQNLESLNNSLEDKYKVSQQKVKDLEMSVIALQSEISRLQVLEIQLLQQSGAAILSPDGKELKLRVDNGNVEENLRESQNELISQEQERNELAQEETTCSESLTALKQEHQQALVKISDLHQKLEKYKAQKQNSKNPSEENTNIAAKEWENLKVLKDKLEEINQKLESSNADKSEAKWKLEEMVAQLHWLIAEQSSIENQATEFKNQHEVLTEEMKTKLATSERKQAEMVLVQTENTKLKHSLQVISEEKTSTRRELTSVLSALEESGQEVARVKKQMEELDNNCRLEVQGMMERTEAIQAERETLEQQKEDLKNKVSFLNKGLPQLTESAAKMELANTKTRGEMERTQAEVEQLRTQLVQLSSKKGALEEKVARMGQRQVDDVACKLEKTQEGKEGAQWQLSSLAKENEELQAELQAMRDQMCSLQQSMAQATSDFEQGMAKKNAECNRQTEALNEALLTEREDIQHKAKELKSKDAELLSLAESLARAKRIEEDLKDTLKETIEDAKSREEKSHREIQDLRETLRSLKERTVELLREKDVLWQKSDKLEFNQRQSDQKRLSRKDRFGSKK
ncbi:FYVE and coiled-coil domain-containing protein 1-like [Carcharodon carcharias]|uniref:FYVE and coiled-coil domain-containing protein 1-like n=1 Tax=Carcharodon carcharias TaxID=13397 RepID=UPI001B7EFAF6|nr:FYVE and coiled-coil domain-containing protein 1-like [Carcharodon carcharias]